MKRLFLSALIGFSALLLAFAPPLLLALPGFFAFIAVAWGPACLGVAVGTSALAVFAAAGLDLASGLLLLALYVPATLVLCFCLLKRKPWRHAAAGCAAAMALGLYCVLCLPSLLAGNGPFGDFEAVLASLGEQFLAAAPALGANPEMLSQMKTYLAYLQLMAPDLVTGTIIGMSLLLGFFAPLIARGLCKAAGAETRPMARFSNWQLGKSFTLGLAVLLLGAVAILMLKLNNAGAMVAAIECIAGGPLALMGVCFITYLRFIKGRGPGYLVLMFGALALLMPFSIYILITLGLMDRILRLRRRNPLP